MYIGRHVYVRLCKYAVACVCVRLCFSRLTMSTKFCTIACAGTSLFAAGLCVAHTITETTCWCVEYDWLAAEIKRHYSSPRASPPPFSVHLVA